MNREWWRYLVVDTVRWLFVPLLAAVMPARLGHAWLRRVARWRWLAPEHNDVRKAAAMCFDEAENMDIEYANIMLVEAMTMWRIRLGLAPQMEVRGQWPNEPGFAAVFGHFGNGIAVLWHLHHLGLRPRLIFRPPAEDLKSTRPVFWLWGLLRFGVILRLCDHDPLPTGGARARMEKMLDKREDTLVVALDTPSPPDTRKRKFRIGKRQLSLREGAVDLLARSGCPVVLFVPVARASDTVVDLIPLPSGELLDAAFGERFEQALDTNPGQWHSWPYIEPYIETPQESQGDKLQ